MSEKRTLGAKPPFLAIADIAALSLAQTGIG